MEPSSEYAPKTILLFLEGPNGVTEFILGKMVSEGRALYSPMAARVASGRGHQFRSNELREALQLQRWAEAHEQVFTEGKVSDDE